MTRSLVHCCLYSTEHRELKGLTESRANEWRTHTKEEGSEPFLPSHFVDGFSYGVVLARELLHPGFHDVEWIAGHNRTYAGEGAADHLLVVFSSDVGLLGSFNLVGEHLFSGRVRELKCHFSLYLTELFGGGRTTHIV